MDEKLKESADRFIEATKNDKELKKLYSEMLKDMETFAVANVYTGAALTVRLIDDKTSVQQAQIMVNEQVRQVEEYIANYIEKENIDHGIALLAVTRILVRLIPPQSLEMVRYMYDELRKQ